MKTKTKPAPTRRKSAPAADSSARVPSYRVHVHPRFAEFFFGEPAKLVSRIPNGAPGSEAALQLERRIEHVRADGNPVSVVQFDEQGREIAFRS